MLYRAYADAAGQLPNGMTPLVNSNTNVENFAPTGAEGVPNAPLFVPYQGERWGIAGCLRTMFAQHLQAIMLSGNSLTESGGLSISWLSGVQRISTSTMCPVGRHPPGKALLLLR